MNRDQKEATKQLTIVIKRIAAAFGHNPEFTFVSYRDNTVFIGLLNKTPPDHILYSLNRAIHNYEVLTAPPIVVPRRYNKTTPGRARTIRNPRKPKEAKT